MTRFPSDEDFRRAYEQFGRDHARLKEELLRSLPEQPRPVRSRPAGTSRRTWIKAAAIAFSVCSVTAVAIWFQLPVPEIQRAYAVEDMRTRIQGLTSLHLEGQMYRAVETPSGEELRKYPVEWYAERPTRYWHTWHAFSPDGVNHGYVASDGERFIKIFHGRKLAKTGESTRLAAELEVERLMQQTLIEQLIGRPPAEYRPVERVELNGVPTVRYECHAQPDDRMRIHHVIWLSTETGLPIQAGSFLVNGAGAKRPLVVFDQIKTNTGPEPHMFSFKAPADYRVERMPQPLEPNPLGSATAGDSSLAVWFAFAVSERSVLLCWKHDIDVGTDIPEAVENRKVPTIRLVSDSGQRPCEQHILASHERPGQTWHWSVVIPTDGEPFASNEALELTTRTSAGRARLELQLLRLPRKRLSELVLAVQRLTGPDEKRTSSLTLEQIESRISDIIGR